MCVKAIYVCICSCVCVHVCILCYFFWYESVWFAANKWIKLIVPPCISAPGMLTERLPVTLRTVRCRLVSIHIDLIRASTHPSEYFNLIDNYSLIYIVYDCKHNVNFCNRVIPLFNFIWTHNPRLYICDHWFYALAIKAQQTWNGM